MRFAIFKMQSACLDEYEGEKAVDFSTQETTIIQHIFGGRLQSQVQCTACGMVSSHYDNMMDLTVEIQGDAESLEKCLDLFTAIEWLDGDNKYKCDRCKDYVKARKHLSVHQAPNILTITLKRSQIGRFGKLNKRVTFPMELDLTPYMSCTNGSDLYDLYAVVVHLDTLNPSFIGHYLCYIKGYQGRWYKIDDCKVMVVDKDEVHAQGAYMLLYSRRTPRSRPLVTVDESVNQLQQCKLLPSNGQRHMILADAALNCESSLKANSNISGAASLDGIDSGNHASCQLEQEVYGKLNTTNNIRDDYEHVKQIFVDLCGVCLSMQVNMKTTTARKLVGLAFRRMRMRYNDVYLLYSGKALDDAFDLSLLHIPNDASFAIVPRFRAGQDNLLTNCRVFVDFAQDIRPFYKVIIPNVLRKPSCQALSAHDVFIVFLSQPARRLVHMMIVRLSRLHAEGESLAGKFEYTDFLFWNDCAFIQSQVKRDKASKVNVNLDFRKLSKIIEYLFRRPNLQPADPLVGKKSDDDLPAYLGDLIRLLRVFVQQGDSYALRAYASNHPSLVSFRERIKTIIEMEVFYNFLDSSDKKNFRNAIGYFEKWSLNIVDVQPIKDAFMFGSQTTVSNFSNHGVDWLRVSRNFLNHPNEQVRGPKGSSLPVGFTEEEAEAALSLYCRGELHSLLLKTVTVFQVPAGVDKKLICGNEMTDASACSGKSGGLEFSV